MVCVSFFHDNKQNGDWKKNVLGFIENNIKSKGACAVFDMLKFNKTLRELNLSRLSFSPCFRSFVMFRFHQPNNVFDTDSNVGRSEIAVLASALETNTSLLELELGRFESQFLFVSSTTLIVQFVQNTENLIDDLGAVQLSNALKINHTLWDIVLTREFRSSSHLFLCDERFDRKQNW